MPGRRRFLTATGTAVTVTLAGCLGGDGPSVAPATTDADQTGTQPSTGGTTDGAGSPTGEDGSTASDDGTTTGDDGSTTGDDGSTAGDDGSTTGDDGSTTGDDGSATGDDEATTQEDGRSPRTVRFPSRSGDDVVGTLWGDGGCAAVFAHGVGYDRSDWGPQATAVASAGHSALSIDLNHDDRPSNVEALAGAVRYLREELRVGTVVFVGASAGANAVVKTEADPEVDVSGLFVLAAGRAAAAATDITGRSLFAVGARDSQRFRDTTRAMYENAPEPKRFETLDSAEHAQGIFGTPAGDQLQSYIVTFVDEVCATT